jgi:hypothetical protein
LKADTASKFNGLQQNPYVKEQGIISTEQGILAREQGILPTKSQIIT